MKRKTKAEREAEALIARQRKALVDEYGRLDARLSPLKGELRRMEELGKIIRSWHAEDDPSVTVSSAGDAYEVVLGPAGMQTHITDIAEVYRTLGQEKFLRCSSVTLKSLESALSPAAVASLTHKTRTGSRSIVVRAVAAQ